MSDFRKRSDELEHNTESGTFDEVLDLSALQRDSGMIGHIRGQIRQQISIGLTDSARDLERSSQTSELSVAIEDVIHEIITSPTCNKSSLASRLESLFQQLSIVYENTEIPSALRTRRYICATGLVLSPDHCTHTIKDTLRIHAFIHGIDKALRELEKKVPGRIHIVYPACGPFAPLLIPLLHYYSRHGIFSSENLCVSLVDIQQGATLALDALVNVLELDTYILDLACCNAMDYRPTVPVHMVVLEALQHGFSREGHLQLARHYAQMLGPEGVFIPREIVVSAALNVGQREYVDQWKEIDNEQVKSELIDSVRSERTELGDILRVNLPMLRHMKVQTQDEYTQLLTCGRVKIPELTHNHDRQLLLICSRVQVFEDSIIDEYDSGITHPLPDMQVCINFTPRDSRPDDLLLRSGDSLQFYYCMNGLPGFLPLKVEKSPLASVENKQAGLKNVQASREPNA